MPNKSNIPIGYRDKLLLMGSCFADHLGERLHKSMFDALVNPLGTFFNPVSAAQLMDVLQTGTQITETELLQRDGIFVHPLFHSRFNHSDAAMMLHSINTALDQTRHFLKRATCVFLTLGTSWVYENIQSATIVSNCHKLPQSQFRKKLLTLEETSAAILAFANSLQAMNPNCRLILTLSPVRHLKDGFENNQLSKAILRLAIQECMQNNTAATYFPAYELVLDDLRDYRFYNEDLLHPNDLAIRYIWEKFVDCYFEENTKTILDKVDEINLFLSHRKVSSGDHDAHSNAGIRNKINEINPLLGRSFEV
jgi:hypothetical protein